MSHFALLLIPTIQNTHSCRIKKSDENSRALALNEKVGENYSPTSTVFIKYFFFLLQFRIPEFENIQNAKCQNLLRSCPENRQIDISLLIW
jgi:hypothetical protein